MKVALLLLGLFLLYIAVTDKQGGVWAILTGQPLPFSWSGGSGGSGGGGGGGSSGFQ